MNYQAFTNDTLLLMHHAARGALVVDDELSRLGQEGRFRVRDTSDWVRHAAGLEAEMMKRGISFDAINWSGDRASPNAADAPTLADGAANAGAEEVNLTTRLQSRIAAVLKPASVT